MEAIKVILAYIPVLHQGYINFLKNHKDADYLYIFGSGLIGKYKYLAKEIRALDPVFMQLAIHALSRDGKIPEFRVEVLESASELEGANDSVVFVMPDEDVCHEFAERYLKEKTVEFDSVFLRWDRKNIHAKDPVQFDREVPFEGFIAEMMGEAIKEAERAPSWWRQVGGVIVLDKEVLLRGHNEHLPSHLSAYTDSDPRNAAKRGVSIELSTDSHAERKLIAQAARKGVSLEGTSLFINTFPCPPCGLLVADSGIKKVYFLDGYSMVDSHGILKASGVEIIHVTQ